ncbi:hypothetical protein IKZ40_03390 [bacterium]|nr:hypothetical protein [bacterium]
MRKKNMLMVGAVGAGGPLFGDLRILTWRFEDFGFGGWRFLVRRLDVLEAGGCEVFGDRVFGRGDCLVFILRLSLGAGFAIMKKYF